MAGASAVVPIVVIFRARTRTCVFAASLRLNRRQHSALHRIQYESRFMARSSRTNGTRSSGQSGSDRARTCQPNSRRFPHRLRTRGQSTRDTDSHGVSDPPDRRGAIASARARVAHAMVSCSDRDIRRLAVGGKERRPHGEASARSVRKSCAANRLRPSTARVAGGRCGSERDSRERDSGGQPQFPRSSPRSSSAVGVRRRQPGGRDAGTGATARRTRPVRVRGRWRRPRWASRPSRACSSGPPATVGRELDTSACGRHSTRSRSGHWQGQRPVRRAVSARGRATPASRRPMDGAASPGAHEPRADRPVWPSRVCAGRAAGRSIGTATRSRAVCRSRNSRKSIGEGRVTR